jgi:Zn-dependent protease with chaperone function
MEQPYASAAGAPAAPVWVPGPEDRESFFAAQQRHRRATWRFAAVCMLVIVVLGVGISFVLTPLSIFAFLWITKFLDIFLPIPDLIYAPFNAFIDMVEPNHLGTLPVWEKVLRLALFCIPGIAAIGLLWLLVRALFGRAGVGGVLLSIGARPPNPQDLEERQLENLAHEMAIAAGIPPPRVMLLDQDISNAAIVGSSRRDATLVVSRRMLDNLDRDETQGVVGHLVGSAGNGDLGIAMLLTSVLQTLGLLMTMLDASYSYGARRSLWVLLKFMLRLHRKEEETVAVSSLLSHRIMEDDDGGNLFDQMEGKGEKTGLPRGCLAYAQIILLFPFIMGALFTKLLIFFMMFIFLGPFLALTWRTRRYLADATAVQLTRNPDGIGRALLDLAANGAVIPGGHWADHLFIIGPEAASQRADDKLLRDMQALRERNQGKSFTEALGQSIREQPRLMREHQAAQQSSGESFGDKHGILLSMHPSLKRRLKRIAKQGARLDAPVTPGVTAQE